MIPCNSDGVVIFGSVFAWGVCALFGQEHLPDAYFRIVWCIFRRHVDFQDILPRKRGFVTKRSTKSQIAWNHDFRRGRGPGRTFQCRQQSKKKYHLVAREYQIHRNSKSFWSGTLFYLKRRARKTTALMQIFVELAPACKKSARAAHHLQHLDDFFEPCAPTVSSAARQSGFKVQLHVISQFRSYHVTSIFSLGA